jgi:hypothetical protein
MAIGNAYDSDHSRISSNKIAVQKKIQFFFSLFQIIVKLVCHLLCYFLVVHRLIILR